jgi:uncharacterized protein (DUF1697 family)
MAGTHIALIRGINVGRAKRVAMADLRTLVQELGYGDVRTLLNSGNVVFTAGAAKGDPAARIETALASTLGVSASVVVLTAAQLGAAVNDNPLGEIATDPSRLLVAFCRSSAQLKSLTPLKKEKWGAEVLAVGSQAAYLWCAGGIIESRLALAIGRILGDAVTTRNWSTVLKLRALAAGS